MSAEKYLLMDDNITRNDINEVIKFLQQDPLPQLTNGPKVREFEQAWSKWLGVKYSVFVNSGTIANQLTMLLVRYLNNNKNFSPRVIVPPLTWVSDIASTLQNGIEPVFCDINFSNLSFDNKKLLQKIEKIKQDTGEYPAAIFLTHILGLNGLTDYIINLCKDNNILLIEDVCESHGTTFKGHKVGTFGDVSNFSFYFAHHMSTIEGGIICTNNEHYYNLLRAFRSHGMVRECDSLEFKNDIIKQNPQLNSDFIFLAPAFNARSTEINAVLGLSQLKKLDNNNEIRRQNFDYFISNLDGEKYIKTFDITGQCNYAFIVILKNGNIEKRNKVEAVLKQNNIEFRRGLSGGGSQIQQPYLRNFYKNYSQINLYEFDVMNYIHDHSWYIGNYPTLKKEKIDSLLSILNGV